LLILLPVYVALALVSVATIAGFFGQVGHYFELASHFRLLYALGFAACLIVLAIMRCWKTLAVGTVLCSINLLPVAALYVPQFKHRSQPIASEISILHFNAWGAKNSDHDPFLQVLRQTSPDVVGVTELTDTWVSDIQKALPDHRYSFVERHCGGVAVFSRYPLSDAQVLYTGTIKRPRIKARLELSGRKITLIYAHTVTPRWQYALRDAELKTVASEARAAGEPVIVCGDLNCSPWSYYFWRLEQEGRLHDTERGFGLQPTWSTHWYFPWVPIDHCLTSSDFITLERKVGPRAGSDHLPVFVTLGLVTKP
jgi:endonuclease/exonuclease/phosphatase (EEP) superfamily protein YafD